MNNGFVSDDDPIYDCESAAVDEARNYLEVAGRYLFSGELNDRRLDALNALNGYGKRAEISQEGVSGRRAEEYLQLEIDQVLALDEEFGGLEDELETLQEVQDIFDDVRQELGCRGLENTVGELKP